MNCSGGLGWCCHVEPREAGFDTLVTCTAPIFWVFFLLTGISHVSA